MNENAEASPREEPSVYARVLVLLKKRLEERGFEIQGVVKPGGRRRGMRPIYAALREMDRVGIKVASGKLATR